MMVDDVRAKIQERGGTLLFLIRSGAHAYGTETPESDEDVRGVFLPKWEALVGLGREETVEFEPDVVLHPLRKFVRLCAQGNPNILDWLFAPNDCELFVLVQFARLQVRRRMFLSRRLFPRFYGYATSHVQKMMRGLTRDLGAKRKLDIEEHGYSTKNAMHLIRLARMGCEVLESGTYNVRRPDAEELLEIRAGKWSLARVHDAANNLLRRMKLAVEKSTLPERPPMEEINGLLCDITREVLTWRR